MMSFKRSTKYKFRHYGKNPDHEVGGDILLWASDGKADISPSEPVVRGGAVDLEIMHSQLWTPNALADEGEIDIYDVYFYTQALRDPLYFSLHDDGAIADADTMATILAEVTEGGYARIAVARGTDWSAPSAADGTTSVTKTFNATATWTDAQAMVLGTALTGTAGLHVAWVNLSTTRSLVAGDALNVDITAELE